MIEICTKLLPVLFCGTYFSKYTPQCVCDW